MIDYESLKSYHDGPDPLRLLCLKTIIRRPIHVCKYVVPPEVGDLLMIAFRDEAISNRFSRSECSRFFKHLKHKFIPLRRIDFSGLQISEEAFSVFLEEYQDQLEEINISNCSSLTWFNLKNLNLLKRNKRTNKTLIIGDSHTLATSSRTRIQERIFDNDFYIKKLVLHKVSPAVDADEFTINRQLTEFLTTSMSTTLKYLDLSMSMIGKGSALMQLESLETLILYNCSMVHPNVMLVISHLKKLRVLDLSRQVIDSDDEQNSLMYDDPDLLNELIQRLPALERLDISGTNLIGNKDRNITALESRSDRPFEFLGLFHTGNDAAYRSFIPAKVVAGEATEAQLLNACEAYMGRSEQLSRALNDLYNLYKTITPSETFDNIERALDVVLPILSRHMCDEQVIIFTTAALWCIIKINVASKNLNDSRVRRTITSRLLDVMHYHKTNRVILINGGLTLLLLPDIICEHSRVASISLQMCRDQDARTQGFGTTLLNTLACQVGGDEKILIGRLDAIKTMLDIIRSKIGDNTHDQILETAWSTLWNITDETLVNCRSFLDCDGLTAFEDCMDKFSDVNEVLRNMMGLLGNVAECHELRRYFMKPQLIRRFESLLVSIIDGIEIGYNACGILAHLVSDGEKAWYYYLPSEISRDKLMEKMCIAISGWPINSRRNINYRSFEPIVRLLDTSCPPAAQYWAVFALTNLTRINPEKYCPMLTPFDGLNKLRRLAESPDSTKPFVSNLARITLYQYERFGEEQTLAGLERCSSIDLETVRNYRAESSTGDGTSEMGEIFFL